MGDLAPRPVVVAADPRLREYDFGPGHPFQVSSRWLAVRLLEEERFFAQGGGHEELREVPIATREELTRFHRPEYLDRVDRAGDSATPGYLDQGDTPAFPGCYRAAARVVGATLAVWSGVAAGGGRRGFQPAGGLHHAHPDRASGFCIFNDVATAIATALGTDGLRRVAYVDIDAHHGDGVMYGFYEDGRVLDIDFHQDGRTLFPGTGGIEETGRLDGSGAKVNLPLPPGSGDRVFGTLFRRIVPAMIRSFRPNAIVLQCGIDGHRGDALAQLAYSPESYHLAVTTLTALSDECCDGRILVTGGGGYEAANVALVLGSVPWWLAGEVLPASVPEPWRAEFAKVVGIDAPRTRTGLSVDRPDADAVADRIVRRLESALGQSFPEPEPVTK